uniref:Fringe n=1 Tax=Panagrolaimus sp. PS1159 TaxID=55785 RepID=A0AC35FB46_9BILA
MKRIKKLCCVYCVFLVFFIILGNYYIDKRNNKPLKPLKILITVKTTFKNHLTRIRQIYDTWYKLAPESIYFISDAFDPVLNSTLQGRFVNTSCGSSHDPISLGCKLDEELKLIPKINPTWYCHVDDDNYVNVPALINTLNNFNPEFPYYIGRTATKQPTPQNGRYFWFAIGGAGICLSKAAIKIMTPSIKDLYNLYATRDGMPDDLALGFIMGLLER